MYAVTLFLSRCVDPAFVVIASRFRRTRSNAIAFVERTTTSDVEFTVIGVEPTVTHFDVFATDPCNRIVAAVEAPVADVVRRNVAMENSLHACGNRKSVPAPTVF